MMRFLMALSLAQVATGGSPGDSGGRGGGGSWDGGSWGGGWASGSWSGGQWGGSWNNGWSNGWDGASSTSSWTDVADPAQVGLDRERSSSAAAADPRPAGDASAGQQGKGKGKGKKDDPDSKIKWVVRDIDLKHPPCDGCQRGGAHWKLMQFVDRKVRGEGDGAGAPSSPAGVASAGQRGSGGDGGGVEWWTREYFCAHCMAEKWQMSVPEAQARIVRERPGAQQRAELVATVFQCGWNAFAVMTSALHMVKKRTEETSANACTVSSRRFFFASKTQRVPSALENCGNQHCSCPQVRRSVSRGRASSPRRTRRSLRPWLPWTRRRSGAS
jgi:hypothetical protein